MTEGVGAFTAGPEESVSVKAWPMTMFVPASGFCAITVPMG
jgi:hypothetical protein